MGDDVLSAASDPVSPSDKIRKDGKREKVLQNIRDPPVPVDNTQDHEGTGVDDSILGASEHIAHDVYDFSPSSTDIYLSPSVLQQNLTTYVAPANGMWSPGIRASSLHGSNNAILPTAKKLIKAPVNGVVDLVNAGLDWIPSLSALAQYISPSSHIGIVPLNHMTTPFGPAENLAMIAGFSPLSGSAAAVNPYVAPYSPVSRSIRLTSGDGVLSDLFDNTLLGGILSGFEESTSPTVRLFEELQG